MRATRKQFLESATLVAGSGLGLLVFGCGSDGSSSSEPESSTGGSSSADVCQTMIASNHGHQLRLPEADVAAGADKTYDITGSADHSHSVSLTAAQFSDLGAGTEVTVTSTSGAGHTHSVRINC
jgi:hypothetical protein